MVKSVTTKWFHNEKSNQDNSIFYFIFANLDL